MTDKRKKVGIIYPVLICGGGSEARPLFIAEALKDKYDVTLIVQNLERLDKLNAYYGTKLSLNEINIIKPFLAFFFKRIRTLDLLWGSIFERFCRNIGNSFDLLISSRDLRDLQKRGIQFIADFYLDKFLREKLEPFSIPKRNAFFYSDNLFRKIYVKLTECIKASNEEAFRKNITIANSKWTATLMEREYGIKCKVIYPPVLNSKKNISWDERENGFVYLGRLVPEKKIEDIIEMVGKIRKSGHKVHLHIVGALDNNKYVGKLISLAKKKWVKLEEKKYGEDKSLFLAKHKYGINARVNEPFGISVAEMVKAGCIVWVPDGGGQTEIVNHKDLIFKNIENGVKKIEKVLRKSTLQKKLRNHLKRQSENFSSEIFKQEVRKLANDFFLY